MGNGVGDNPTRTQSKYFGYTIYWRKNKFNFKWNSLFGKRESGTL